MSSIVSRLPLLAPEFEPVLTANPLGGPDGDGLRVAEFTRYLDALAQPRDHPQSDGAFTRRWSEQELSVIYGVAAALADVKWNTIHVRAGVDRGRGTRHYRSSSEYLVVHDLYDRMFVELTRVMAQTIIQSGDREIGRDAADVELSLTAAVVAASFARDSASSSVHAQLLANLKMASFQSATTRARITYDRRNGRGILPRVQMAMISDLIMALHELSHTHVTELPHDSLIHVVTLTSFTVDYLDRFSESLPGTQEVIAFLKSPMNLIDAALSIMVEADVDTVALNCLKDFGLYQRIDARTTACVMFGVTLLEFCRKAGSLLTSSSDPHEAIIRAKALAVLRLGNAIAIVLSGQDTAPEEVLRRDGGFMTGLFFRLLDATRRLEALFVGGLHGSVVNSFSPNTNNFFDKNVPDDNMRAKHEGSVEIVEIEKWATDLLLRNWVDYSKPNRTVLQAEMLLAKARGRAWPGKSNEHVFLYLKDELAAEAKSGRDR